MEQQQNLTKRQLRKLEKQQKPKQTFDEFRETVKKMPDMNPFKYMEKCYKLYNNVETDFKECLDFSDPNLDLQKHNITKKTIQGYEVFALNFPQGVYVIKNAMSIKDQLDVALSCMNEYIHPPYRNNLFIYDQDKKDTIVQKKKENEEENAYMQQQDPSEYDKDKFVVNDFEKFNFDTKIRWTNVGSQYDWDNRQYPMISTPMPQKILDLGKFCQDIFGEEIPNINKYTPESVIINFYHKKSYMTGHLDDGEEDQESPIFSFSFGAPCVFLMGDKTKDFEPIPIMLSSGDLMVMSGYSRQCYHGVPRILTDSFDREKYIKYLEENKPELFVDREAKKDLKNFKNDEIHLLNLFKQTRINLNFRQVESIKNKQQTENQQQQQN